MPRFPRAPAERLSAWSGLSLLGGQAHAFTFEQQRVPWREWGSVERGERPPKCAKLTFETLTGTTTLLPTVVLLGRSKVFLAIGIWEETLGGWKTQREKGCSTRVSFWQEIFSSSFEYSQNFPPFNLNPPRPIRNWPFPPTGPSACGPVNLAKETLTSKEKQQLGTGWSRFRGLAARERPQTHTAILSEFR